MKKVDVLRSIFYTGFTFQVIGIIVLIASLLLNIFAHSFAQSWNLYTLFCLLILAVFAIGHYICTVTVILFVAEPVHKIINSAGKIEDYRVNWSSTSLICSLIGMFFSLLTIGLTFFMFSYAAIAAKRQSEMMNSRGCDYNDQYEDDDAESVRNRRVNEKRTYYVDKTVSDMNNKSLPPPPPPPPPPIGIHKKSVYLQQRQSIGKKRSSLEMARPAGPAPPPSPPPPPPPPVPLATAAVRTTPLSSGVEAPITHTSGVNSIINKAALLIENKLIKMNGGGKNATASTSLPSRENINGAETVKSKNSPV
jgi:hypothetical protein